MTGSIIRTGRRAVLTATAVGAVAAVGGCARYDQNAPTAAPPAATPDAGQLGAQQVGAQPAGAQQTGAEPADAGPADPATSSGPAAVDPPSLAALDRIPVGGGLILADQGVVLSRPTRDRVVAFSATCTHQGCAVSTLSTDTVDCPCHGSRFRLTDGSVADGPARRPLDRVEVEVRDGQVTRR